MAFPKPDLLEILRRRAHLGAPVIGDGCARSAGARPLRRAVRGAGEEQQDGGRSISTHTLRRPTTGGQVHAGVYGHHMRGGGCASITTAV
eukprot:scaffold112543_cov36-Phaeocystis_antarctica.AAC.3